MHPAPEPAGPARLALLVATTRYTDPGLRQLRAPARDAADLGDVLADPGIGGFTTTRVVDRPEYEVRRAIDGILAGRGVADLVLVYLSCHGVLDARGRLYFAAADTSKQRLGSTAVESSWLLDRLEDCRARRQVLILDCCFSGAFDRTKGDAAVDLERRLVGSGRGRAVLTASRAGEYSYEGEPLADGTPTGSVFTTGLVEGLCTGRADYDLDGYITVDDAYRYAADYVHDQGGSQSPQRWLFGGEGEIMLARTPVGGETAAGSVGGTGAPGPAVTSDRAVPDRAVPDRPGAAPASGVGYPLADVRQLLGAALTDDELTELCQDHFPAVYGQLSAGMSRSQKTTRLLDHCARRNQLPDLVRLVGVVNPAKYDEFADRFGRGRGPGG